MRKIILYALIIVFIISTCSCTVDETFFPDKTEQEYKKGFEEIEQALVDEFGDYVLVDIFDDDSQIILSLMLKGTYTENEQVRKEIPEYKIIENSRNIVNEYICNEPDSQLANMISKKKGYIRLYSWTGSHTAYMFSICTQYENNIFSSFVVYDEINTGKYNVDDDYKEAMYNYISRTGQDIVYIEIKNKNSLDDAEQEVWHNEVKSLFPNFLNKD